MKVKIFGAGSIGNHLSQAARRMGWDVVLVDKDEEALRRMREEIYPGRYGAWDEGIQQFKSGTEPKGGFDVIFIGTPPESHIPLAIEALKEKPKVLQIEKPLCPPTLDRLDEFLKAYRSQSDTVAVVGYDHAIAASLDYVLELLSKNVIGEVETLDVEFRQHWAGIFQVHPWLAGPHDTYLGFTKRGGGASGEHSHALHLWQFLAKKAGLGVWNEVTPVYHTVKTDLVEYDSIASFAIVTDSGKFGRVIQDVVTSPSRQWLRIQGKDGYIEWIVNGHPDGDLVRLQSGKESIQDKVFQKKRPDDFYREMLHINDIIDKKILPEDSPLFVETAVSVMAVLATAYEKRGSVGIAIPKL